MLLWWPVLWLFILLCFIEGTVNELEVGDCTFELTFKSSSDLFSVTELTYSLNLIIVVLQPFRGTVTPMQDTSPFPTPVTAQLFASIKGALGPKDQFVNVPNTINMTDFLLDNVSLS